MVGLPAIRQAGLGQGFSGFTYFSLRFIRRVCGGLASRQYGGLFSVNYPCHSKIIFCDFDEMWAGQHLE
jgi:hypothetical protein